MPSQKKILEVKNLKKYFPTTQKQQLKAVDNVSFDIYEGETLGIVGESGCGKTTCGKTCLGMYPVTDGEVLFHGKNIHTMSKKDGWIECRACSEKCPRVFRWAASEDWNCQSTFR